MDDEKKVKITFAPGAFDGFDGTQEELNELIAEITEYFNTHSKEEIMANSTPLLESDLSEEELENINKILNGGNTTLH